MISMTFGCTLKGYFNAKGLIQSFRWLRVMGCKAVSLDWVDFPVLLPLVVVG